MSKACWTGGNWTCSSTRSCGGRRRPRNNLSFGQLRHQPPDQVRAQGSGLGFVEIVDQSIDSLRVGKPIALADLTDLVFEQSAKSLLGIGRDLRRFAAGFAKTGE